MFRNQIAFGKAIFREYIVLLTGGIITAVVGLSEHYKNQSLSWPWYCAILLSFVVIACYRAWVVEHGKVPDMVRLEPCGSPQFQVCRMTFTFPNTQPEVGSCLRARFINKASAGKPGKNACGVIARITYTDQDGSSYYHSGRWAESTQPEALHPLESKLSLLPIDFLVGMEHDLDIAVKFAREPYCYAVNNESFPWMRIPEKQLKGPIIKVKVELTGETVNEVFEFKFTNPGSDHFLVDERGGTS
jgi:hypothetical protein